jgi:hypothetical protein
MREFGSARIDAQAEAFDSTRDFYSPPVITKVPTNLTHDRGNGETQELRTGFDIVAGHRLDQSDPRDLQQIFVGLAAVLEASRNVIGKRQTVPDDRVALVPEVRGVGAQCGQELEHWYYLGVVAA